MYCCNLKHPLIWSQVVRENGLRQLCEVPSVCASFALCGMQPEASAAMYAFHTLARSWPEFGKTSQRTLLSWRCCLGPFGERTGWLSPCICFSFVYVLLQLTFEVSSRIPDCRLWAAEWTSRDKLNNCWHMQTGYATGIYNSSKMSLWS